MQQKSIQNGAPKVAYIFMNVKGRDLLSVDEESDKLDTVDHAMYKNMDLQEVPFRNVKYFYPYGERGTVKSYVHPDVLERQLQSGQAKKFKFTFNEDNECLDLLFSNIEDPNQTIESIINYIISKQPPFNNVDSWGAMLEEVQSMGEKGSSSNKEISVMSWRKFKRIVRKSVETDKMFNDDVDTSKNEVRLENEIKNLKTNVSAQ